MKHDGRSIDRDNDVTSIATSKSQQFYHQRRVREEFRSTYKASGTVGNNTKLLL